MAVAAAPEDEKFWHDHVAAWRDSGQRRTEYCAARGLPVRRFNAWEQHLRLRFRFRPQKTGQPRDEPASCLWWLPSPRPCHHLQGTSKNPVARGGDP